HVNITVRATRAGRIHIQTDSRRTLLARPAASAGHVERYRDEIADTDELHVASRFDNLAGDLMSEDEPWLGRRPSPHHVPITPADIGAHDFQNHAVIAPLTPGIDQLRKIDAAHLDFAGPNVNDSAIATHVRLSS